MASLSTQVCRHCGVEKPVSQVPKDSAFAKQRLLPNGLYDFRTTCKKCATLLHATNLQLKTEGYLPGALPLLPNYQVVPIVPTSQQLPPVPEEAKKPEPPKPIFTDQQKEEIDRLLEQRLDRMVEQRVKAALAKMFAPPATSTPVPPV